MPILRQQSFELGGAAGDNGGSWTRTINLAPASVSAQVSLFGVYGNGLQRVGIRSFRTRPDPDGPEHAVTFGVAFGDWPSFLAVVEHLSSITWAVTAGADQEAFGRLDLLWWG
jgi:hypothetical protein